MFRFNKPQKDHIFPEGDGDDDELFSGTSEKLASLFEDELPNKNPKSLKYVPPKQPSKDSSPSAGLENSSMEKHESSETNTVVLFATAVELFSYQNQETHRMGPVMCCICYKKSSNSSVLLIYKSKESTITQADIGAINLTIQKDHYVSFTDPSKKQYSLHLHGNKFEHFLFQVGICRANSFFQSSSTSIFKQPLSYSKFGTSLKEGDCPRLNFCSWQVENLKIGKLIDKSHDCVEVHLTSEESSWKKGLIDCKPDQRYAIFVKEDSGNSFNIVAYKVIFEDLDAQENAVKNEVKPSDSSSMKKENEKSKKAALISRMAKVGQPLLPSTPKHNKKSPSFPTDSESEEDPSFRRSFRSKNGFPSSRSSPSSSAEDPHPSCNKLTSQNVSTSSSIEEINARKQKKTEVVETSASDISFHNVNQIPYYATGRKQQSMTQGTFQPNLQGTVIAYQPQPVFQQPQPQLQNPPHNSSDQLLSLLFAESRSQNTDMRVALSQLTQKIDLVYSKVDAMDYHATSSVITTGSSRSNGTEYDPQDLLRQITTLVEQLRSFKEKVALKDERLEQLSQDYTQVLKKNQMLLEEKAELLSLKSEAFESKRESEMRIREVKISEEQRLSLKKELEEIKKDTEQKKNFSDELETKLATLQEECKIIKIENTRLNDELNQIKEDEIKFSEEKQCLKSEIMEMKKMAEDEKEILVQTYTDKLKNIDIENLKLKDEIKIKNKVEMDLKVKLESQEQIIIDLSERLKITKQMNIETKSEIEKKLETQLEKQVNLITEKDIQLKSKMERICQLENKVKELEKIKLHPKKTSATNTDVDSSGSSGVENDHKKIDVEVVGKDIMNIAYRILKKGLNPKQMYDKQRILDTVINAFRETILKYTEEKESKNTKETSETKTIHQSEETNTSMVLNPVTKKPVEESLVESVNRHPDRSGHVEGYSAVSNTKVGPDNLENNDKGTISSKPAPPTNNSTNLSENRDSSSKKLEEIVSESSIKISSGEMDTVPLNIGKGEPSTFVDPTPKHENLRVSSDSPKETTSEPPTARFSTEVKDDDDLTWKTGPPPPPPPLFSDSEDNDDWFS